MRQRASKCLKNKESATRLGERIVGNPVGQRTYREGMKRSEYSKRERLNAVSWKQSTAHLPPEAKIDGELESDGISLGVSPVALPRAYAVHNLLQEVRVPAIRLFLEERISWHNSISDGPSNHLLDSQVQCVNALMPLVADAERARRALSNVYPVAEVLQIEPDRYMTFEYIGAIDYLNERPTTARSRGAYTTSIDAAALVRAKDGRRVLLLIEWKYTESYLEVKSPRPTDQRCRALLEAADCLIRWRGRIDVEDLFLEPFYQLMRQQLLANEIHKAREHGVDAVVVVHACPSANDGYADSLHTEQQREMAGTVQDLWQLLVDSERFVAVDTAVFAPTAAAGYVERYFGRDLIEHAYQ